MTALGPVGPEGDGLPGQAGSRQPLLLGQAQGRRREGCRHPPELGSPALRWARQRCSHGGGDQNLFRNCQKLRGTVEEGQPWSPELGRPGLWWQRWPRLYEKAGVQSAPQEGQSGPHTGVYQGTGPDPQCSLAKGRWSLRKGRCSQITDRQTTPSENMCLLGLAVADVGALRVLIHGSPLTAYV